MSWHLLSWFGSQTLKFKTPRLNAHRHVIGNHLNPKLIMFDKKCSRWMNMITISLHCQKCGIIKFRLGLVYVLWCLMPLSTIFQLYRGGQFIDGGNWRSREKKQYFSYIVAVSFIGRGKPQTCCKSLSNFIA